MALPLRDPKTIYEEHSAPLSDDEKLRLLVLISESVVGRHGRGGARLADLDGLGRDAWDGVDPDAYVGGLRDEWQGRT
ncbi:hypothetical protein L6R53_31805 [Myxococcota bacterium]|nr:hypothetical protein [Myxococcota bacterium]